MKKILSVFLAVLMLFGALSISSSAAKPAITPAGLNEAINWTKNEYGADSMYDPATNPDGYVIVCFSVGEGEFMYDVDALDMSAGGYGTLVKTVTPGDRYYQVPVDANTNFITCGDFEIPYVREKNTEEKQFVKWVCNGNQQSYSAGDVIQLTSDMITSNTKCIYFVARYIDVAPQSDTLETIINVLVKVFGSIIGFLFMGGDPDAGTKFMADMIAGIIAGM